MFRYYILTTTIIIIILQGCCCVSAYKQYVLSYFDIYKIILDPFYDTKLNDTDLIDIIRRRFPYSKYNSNFYSVVLYKKVHCVDATEHAV